VNRYRYDTEYVCYIKLHRERCVNIYKTGKKNNIQESVYMYFVWTINEKNDMSGEGLVCVVEI
jgi:hypothetical protein